MENKKPLLETESFRAFLCGEEETKEMKTENTFKLQYKDMEINLTGFVKVVNNDKKVIFVYKIKSDEKYVLYYKFDDISKEDNEKFNIFLQMINYFSNSQYAFVDMRLSLESVYQEQRVLDKLAHAQAEANKNG